MPTKAELSAEINESLGTDIQWDRLLEEDIQLLHELVMSGDLIEPMIKGFVKKNSKEALEKKIDDWYPGKYAMRVL